MATYGTATWSGATGLKYSVVSDVHDAVKKGCWSVGESARAVLSIILCFTSYSAGVLGFVFATLLAGLFGVLAGVYTDFGLSSSYPVARDLRLALTVHVQAG